MQGERRPIRKIVKPSTANSTMSTAPVIAANRSLPSAPHDR